jgi:hypothetical protein
MKEVVTDDLLREQGWSARSVTAVSCVVTAICGAIVIATQRGALGIAWSVAGFSLSFLWIAMPRIRGGVADVRASLPGQLARGSPR